MQTRIKEYRARAGLTQEDLARRVGVRRETIVFLEQGKYNPSLKLAHDVAVALHATIDDLFIFEEDERRSDTL
jgi:putative transcriptional regulator